VQQSCVVVGGGIGGLVTAAKLAQSGYAVTLCEQGSALGGRCATVALGPFRFDTGPSLLLLPQYYASTFEWLGSSLDQHVQLARVEPAAYRVWFPDSSRAAHGGCFTLDLLYDAQAMVAQLEAVQAGAGTQYLAWLSDARKALVLGSGNFIARDFEGWGDFLDPGRLLPLLTQLNVAELLGSHHSRCAGAGDASRHVPWRRRHACLPD
jgi:phytoene dehydrogenase-like protein